VEFDRKLTREEIMSLRERVKELHRANGWSDYIDPIFKFAEAEVALALKEEKERVLAVIAKAEWRQVAATIYPPPRVTFPAGYYWIKGCVHPQHWVTAFEVNADIVDDYTAIPPNPYKE
jgi:hypothetical protein